MKNANAALVRTPSANDIAQALHAQATLPTMALLFHTRDRGQHLSLITAHKVGSNRRQQATIEPGRPLSPEDELHILRLLQPSAISDAFTVYPEGLLHTNASYTMWWLPPTRYPMALVQPDRDGSQFRDVVWPNLVVLAMQRRLFVVAVAGDARPTADSACFAAPIANLWASTELCTGSAVLPEACDVASIAAWTSVLRDTAFSHGNADVIRDPKKKGKHLDPMAYWRNATPQAFPDAALVPLKFALRDWLDFIAAVGRR